MELTPETSVHFAMLQKEIAKLQAEIKQLTIYARAIAKDDGNLQFLGGFVLQDEREIKKDFDTFFHEEDRDNAKDVIKNRIDDMNETCIYQTFKNEAALSLILLVVQEKTNEITRLREKVATIL